MGYYLENDKGDQDCLASGMGYGDLIRWVESLPVSKFKNLHHLVQYGWVEEVGLLTAELSTAIQKRPPEDMTVMKTAQEMLKLLTGWSDAKFVVVTNGIGPVTDDEDEECDEDEDETS